MAAVLDNEATFASFGLDPRLQSALTWLKYKQPTLIQAQCIPLAIQGKDILARAKTGSGKTVAFAVPVVQKLLHIKKSQKSTARCVRALILAPTRELVEQIREVFEGLTRYCAPDITVLSLAGDVPVGTQKPRLAELPDIVVATPSRLVAHMTDHNISLQQIELLVVDEADLVMSYGYDADVRTIATAVPVTRQAFLMSATLSPEIDSLKKLILHNAVVLKLHDAVAPDEEKLTQYSVKCKDEDKFLLMYALLKLRIIKGKSIVFVNDIARCYKLKLFLDAFSLRAAVLNSELPSESRQHILNDFNRSLFDTLIATDESLGDEADDVEAPLAAAPESTATPSAAAAAEQPAAATADTDDAEQPKKKRKSKKKFKEDGRKEAEYGVARGIDFKGVDTVVNFDFARTVRSHVHRIGRTARAGASGMP
eukprot:TRINITY_DN6652_c0_g1_i1.p1 TRINITY_DN6652_c0_g1~~TRINITY_DN6652_c0_g1_i1.p1  ORF type:complete len:433 (-),score=112.56 TRINITY_DN6652_c0_g1_i1:660-1934(-)